MKYLVILTAGILVSFTNCYSHEKRKVVTKDSTIVTSDGTKLFIKISGQGPPCIFVHGGPGAWSRSFEALGGNALEEKLTMYYYDHRGSGRSSSPGNKDFSLSTMVEDIEKIRVATGNKKVYLLAHSFGGILAYNYALRYAEHVEGLILLNATLSVKHSLTNQIAFVNKLLGTNFSSSASGDVISTFTTAVNTLRQKGYGYKMLSLNKINVDKLDSVDNSLARNYDFARIALSKSEYLDDYTINTFRLKLPVLIITGKTDHNIGPDHYKRFRFPNRKVKVVDGGHLLYFENNKAFKEMVFSFIRMR